MFEQFERIKEEMRTVYLHDQRPWMIGFSGGKDSTMLCQLVFEMLEELPAAQRKKKIYIVTSDTMVENPIVKRYMHRMSAAINLASAEKAEYRGAYHLPGDPAVLLEPGDRTGLSDPGAARIPVVHGAAENQSVQFLHL